jgi:acyl-CoA synthetase (AMP-forming)/AMP-acid ligase II
MPLILPVLNDLADLTSFAALSDIESSVSSIVHNPPLSSSTAINMSEADDMSLLRRLGIAADVHKPPIAKSSIACPSLWLFQGSKHLSSPERQAGFNSLDEALSNSSSERPSKSVRADLLPSDLLFYVFTSGTTGAAPKAAKIRHLRFLLAGPAFFTAHRLDPSYDRLYCPLPLYHSSAGMIAVSMCWFGAMPLIVRNKFSASQFFPDCVKYQVCGVVFLLFLPSFFSSIEFLISGDVRAIYW